MRRNAHRLGAIFYALWGVLHLIGGGAILATLKSEGGTAALAMFGTALAPDVLPTASNTVVDALMAYHSFNIVWIGAVVTVVAVRLNWTNSVAGYWINLVLVSLLDIGLFVTQVFPGQIALGDAMIGATLWIPAVAFSTIAITTRSPNRRRLSGRDAGQILQGV